MIIREGKLPFFRSIRGKLLLAFLGLTLVPLVAVSWIAWARAQNALKQAAYDKLSAVQTIKKTQIEEYFVGRQGDMVTLLDTVDSLHQEAFSKLAAVQGIKKDQVEQVFSGQQAAVTVLTGSPNLFEMYDVLIAHDESLVDPTLSFPIHTTEYYSMTAPYDEFLTEYAETYGFHDLLFICADHGHVMYTVAKESDLGVNLSSSALGDSGLGKLWREVTTNESVAVVDFEPYAPSGDVWTSFVGAPVYDLDGQLVGVFAVKIVVDPINAIVQERTDMGEASEAFLVAREPDGRITLRSDRDAAGDGEHVVGYDITEFAPQYVRDALNGERGTEIFIEDDGCVDIVSYEPLNIEGLNWAIISRIDVEDALVPRVQGRQEDFFAQYQELYGYQDMFLINSEGYVFYSVAQKPDYQTNLLDGPYSDSNLGQLVGQVLETGQLGFTDFDSYAPSGGDLAAFIAQPVTRDREGGNQIEIVVAVQLPIDGINAIMQDVAGLGDSGETYLVGWDNRMRSDSSRFPETHSVAASFAGTVEENGVDTEASRRGLDGHGGVGVIPNYKDQMVVSAWDAVDVPGLNWVIIAEEDANDALAAANDLGNVLAVISVGLELILIVVIVWVAGTVARPVLQITDVAQSIAQGNLDVVAEVEARDETSVLASAFNQMVIQLRDMLRNEQEQREYLESTVREYVEYMEAVGQGDLTLQMDIDGNGRRNDMLSVLGHTLNRTTATIQDMTRQIHNAANNLTSSAAEILAATTQQASGASEQSAAISQTTTTVDELKTIAEQSVTRAQDVAGASRRTVEVSRAGQQSVEEIVKSMREIKARVEGIAENILALSEQTQQIGDIISTVNDIAAQSNILALNASVEAARAGEYGKGFAVVAVEVRNLAEQSRQATAQVKTILSDIQKATNATVMATEEGTKGVDEGVRLTEQAGNAIVQLAGVIQESAQAAAQMVAGGRQQAAGVEQVALAMQNINQSTVQSLSSTRQAEKAARELNQMAGNLTKVVEQYKL